MRMRGYSPREFDEILKKKGWSLSRISGSHHTYTHPESKRVITVPTKKREICRPLSKRILKEVEAL